ncbi:UNVERIFIED_CONTAM: Retrovirus-related Pol polyprotein from transposon RE1 [Sesamum calycinum]|uniref:Retrovirus-related Pol polyprotein from transposon RE1 n=1 Tax=Sesamum calycinum TaxID=2727403 RepID=A0AAW2Q3J7_9LAMI
MHQELTALEENKTWEVVDLPSDKRAIGSKWVYKVKLKPDGSVDRYKARLVAKGYNQIEGIDYVERFSPVAKAVTVCIFLALASGYSWAIHQVDINNAFLHGYLDEDIYMIPPEGSNESLISPVKDYLHKLFTIKDMGPAKYFLGLEIARSSAGTSVTQQKYIRDLIVDAGPEHAKSAITPLPLGLKLTSCGGPVLVILSLVAG